MTEKERYEEDILKNCIQEAYGYSDDQILAELDEIEDSLSDDEFPGLEERMYGKLMERMDAESKHEEPVAEKNEETPAQVVRFGKRKVLVIGVLAAAFVGLVGGTAIGDRNFFLRQREKELGIVFNNENNLKTYGDLLSAYEEIKKNFGGSCLALNGWPKDMIFTGWERSQSKEVLLFEYNGSQIYFIQMKQGKTTSVGLNSDRNNVETVKNMWLNMELDYCENIIEDGNIEYESTSRIGEITYWLHGKMSKEEFENILKNINYY